MSAVFPSYRSLPAEHFRAHLLDREYMSGVERDASRIKQTAEVFTPDALVCEVLDNIDRVAVEDGAGPQVADPAKRVLDPACGDGQFLAHTLWRRLSAGHDFLESLSTIYGVELMPDNAEECRKRLACGVPEALPIVSRNIVTADALLYLEYHGRFDGTPFDEEDAKRRALEDKKTAAKARAAERRRKKIPNGG